MDEIMQSDSMREKAAALFTYLRDFSIIKGSVPLNLDSAATIKKIFLSEFPQNCKYVELTYKHADDNGSVLIIHKPDFETCPPPPDNIAEWINPRYTNYKFVQQFYYFEEKNCGEDIPAVHFGDDSERVAAYNEWVKQRDEWREKQNILESIRKIFSALHEIHSEITQNQETYDFIIADGFIKVRHNSKINYPIIFKKLSITFDPKDNFLTILNVSSDTELDDAFLNSVDGVALKAIPAIKRDIAAVHPLDDKAEEVLKVLIHSLSHNSRYIPLGEEPNFQPMDEVIIYHNPVLILRKKYNYSTQAIEKILNKIKENKDFSVPMSFYTLLDKNFQENKIDEPEKTIEQELASVGGEDKEILLGNLANQEQLSIARNIEHYNAVVVQGPPGTGKTHTIANLLGHFLSQGKSVLITSHTEKALSVLKDKINEEIQPLCVYLSSLDTKGTEASLNNILEEFSKASPAKLKMEIDRLAIDRDYIMRELADKRSKIYNKRHSEASDIIINGEAFSLADISKYVGENCDSLSGIIPGKLESDSPFPLSDEELRELYAYNKLFHDYETTDPGNIIFNYNNNSFTIDCKKLILNQAMLNEIETLSRLCQPTKEWEVRAAVDGKRGSSYSKKWIDLTEKIQYAVTASDEFNANYYDKQIEINCDVNPALISTLEEIASIYEKKKKLGAFTLFANKAVSKVYNSVKINGTPLSSKEDCQAVLSYITMISKREEFTDLWGFLMVDSSLNLNVPELSAQKYIEPIKYYLQWFKNVWSKMDQFFSSVGIPINQFLTLEPTDDDSVTISHLSHALTDAMPTITRICSTLAIRKTYLDRISSCAPEWANAIECRRGIHACTLPPKYIREAWQWQYFNKKYLEHTQMSIDDLQKSCEALCVQYRAITAKLAAKKAWFHVIKKLDDKPDLNKDLKAWQDVIKKLGKGAGKNAPFFRAEAQKKMEKCQKAVPCWIMSTNKALETLNPCNNQNQFDIIIFDEASQSDATALAIAYMGKKLIIVGDDKQVSPNPVGIDTNKLNQAFSKIKDVIPNSHLYLTGSSLYDIANINFNSLMLTEHFRCVPDIIGYSNKLAYDYKIKPLRESSSSKLLPHIINYHIAGYRNDTIKTNLKEAQTIVALISACIKAPEYKGKTIGVISLLGNDGDQIKEIRKLIYKHIDFAEINDRRIYCGKASDFQGDERDVIFLSMVDSSADHTPMRLVTPEANNGEYKKRYNVATSRAKDQLWVINSIDTMTDLKDGDIRKDLLTYSNDPAFFNNKVNNIIEKSESPFEEDVCKALVARNYSIEQQYKVGAYRIDIVVTCGENRIAVECDGNRFHSSENQILNDMKRQTILERIGWKFIRIPGSEYYYDPEQCIKKLCDKLSANEIYPVYSETNTTNSSNTLYDNISRSANTWLDENYYK